MSRFCAWLALLILGAACHRDSSGHTSSADFAATDGLRPAWLLSGSDSVSLVELGSCQRERLREVCSDNLAAFVPRDSIGLRPLSVHSGSEIHVRFLNRPVSMSIHLGAPTEDAAVPLRGMGFHVPSTPGTYDYTVSAAWGNEDAIYAGRVRVLRSR